MAGLDDVLRVDVIRPAGEPEERAGDDQRDDADDDDARRVARERRDALVPSAPIRPAAGRVRIHATAMLRTTFQWILPPALPRPVPMMPPATTWVVESEKPKYEEARIVRRERSRPRSPAAAGVGDARAERPDHAPAARERPERDRRGAGELDPEGNGIVGAEATAGDQREGDDAHRLLRVIRAVRERHERARPDLAEPEAAGGMLLGDLLREAVGEPRGEVRGSAADEGREQGGKDDLREDAAPVTRPSRRQRSSRPARRR